MRLVTVAATHVPGLWPALRLVVVRNFDRLAAEWEGPRTAADRLAPLRAALEAVPHAPARVLDLGTGTGAAARLASALWPESEVVGTDVSPQMVAEARRLATSDRQRYEVADAAGLPYADGSFQLVLLNNMIPFFDELARVVAPGGGAVVAYAHGPRTPIWVPLDRVERELAQRGFADAATFSAGDGLSLLAWKGRST